MGDTILGAGERLVKEPAGYMGLKREVCRHPEVGAGEVTVSEFSAQHPCEAAHNCLTQSSGGPSSMGTPTHMCTYF